MTTVLHAPEAAIETGWYHTMPMRDYLRVPAMSSGGMLDFQRSPAHFRYMRDNPKPSTDAMRIGTALHLALLEPDEYAGRYIALDQCAAITGKGARCTNTGTVYRDGASFCGVRGHDPQSGEPMAEGIEVMANEALGRVEGMRSAALDHPEAQQFFRGAGRSEVTGIWRDEATGVLCKIRLDREIDRAQIHADVKTTGDASEGGFRRQIARMGYVSKCAWYRRGMAALGKPAIASVLIAVESDPPHGCAAYLIDEDDITAAASVIDRHLARYAECVALGVWPGYDTGLRHMKVPAWALPSMLEESND